MRFLPTAVEGAHLLEQERIADARGWFARTWDAEELRSRGLAAELSQCSSSFNHRKGTLRGMHWQAPPFAEVKIVRCPRGALFDVAVDLRPDSPSFRKWAGVELSAENGRALYIPKGCAHGFLTLADQTEVHYQISAPYHPQSARGARFDDPLFEIDWPARPSVILDRDRDYPDLATAVLEELRGL